MKKVIIFLFIITSINLFSNREENVIIPKESIRFRIIANSNSFEDQKQKWEINEEIIPTLTNITNSSTSLGDARISINKNIPNIEKAVKKYSNHYLINYGQNYFPKKEYNGIEYPSGNYESLVITLGDGLGDNWWCVLFPPLCLMEAKSDDYDNITYKSYIKEIINNHL